MGAMGPIDPRCPMSLGFPRSWTAPPTVRSTQDTAKSAVRGTQDTAKGPVRGTRDTAKSAVRGTPDTAEGAVRGTWDTAMSAVRGLCPKYGGYMPKNWEYTRKKSRYMQDFSGMAFF